MITHVRTCRPRFSFLTLVVALRHCGSGVGVQRCQVVSHHAGAVLRPHLQTLRLPEGQSVTPRAAPKSENFKYGGFQNHATACLCQNTAIYTTLPF